jgi:hypothetical protein
MTKCRISARVQVEVNEPKSSAAIIGRHMQQASHHRPFRSLIEAQTTTFCHPSGVNLLM